MPRQEEGEAMGAETPGDAAQQESTVGGSVSAVRETPNYTYLVAAVAAIGGMPFGYDIGVISGAENLLKSAFRLVPDRRRGQVVDVLDLRDLRRARHRVHLALRPGDQGAAARAHRPVLDAGQALARIRPA
jgi:hypothetical protein